MKTKVVILITSLIVTPALGQTLYKCPDPSGVTKFQQMPCSPTGGGETITVKPPKPGDNSAAESTERIKAYSAELNKEWEERAKAEKAESDRKEALAAEHRKARAAEAQAAAQRATAAAIWATGGRR